MEKSNIEASTLKRSLVLAGGGIRLAYHAGVLIALEEAGIGFSHVDGTSGGIFGAAMLASGITPSAAAERWQKLNLKGFISLMPFKDYFKPLRMSAAGSTKGIRKKIFPGLGIDVQKIRSSTLFTTFNLCNFSKKTIEAIPNKEITEDHLIAGMSLPVIMPAIKIDGDWYTDAIWIKDANLLEAVKYGAGEIWLIWCIGNHPDYLNGAFQQYVHMIEMSANGGLFNELEWIRKTNEERQRRGLEPISLHIVKPEYPLPLDPDFLVGRIDACTLISMGYADTVAYLSHKEAFSFEGDLSLSTKMKSAVAYLHFRKRYHGTIEISGTLCSMDIYLPSYLREIEGKPVIQQFAAVSINGGRSIYTYNHRVERVTGGRFESSFEFNHDKLNYHLTIFDQLGSGIDLLMGLAFKKCKVIIESKEGRAEAIFTQSISARLRNAFYTHVATQAGWWKKQKLKRKMLSRLIQS